MFKRFVLVLLVLATVIALAGCGQSSPGGVVKQFYGHVNNGQFDKAAALFSQATISQFGLSKLQSLIQAQKQTLDARGGVKNLKILQETIVKEQASVEIEMQMGDGSTQNSTVNLIKEGRDWRISAAK